MTLKQKAQAGIITDAMRAVAEYEDTTYEYIRNGISEGSIVIPQNKNRDLPLKRAIGKGLRTKINANIGVSPYHMDLQEELEKLEAAVEHGADAIMDLSLGPQQIEIRREIIRRSPVMVGTVPIYQTGFELAAAGRDITDMHIDDYLKTIERQARDGVDFMTIHSGINRQTLQAMENQGRTLDVVSRGGSFLVAWIKTNGCESPLFEHYDAILDVLAEYDVTISLGDGMRPGATADATDRAQIAELLILGELTQRAWDRGVQVMIEGPGHVPLNMVVETMKLEKTLCQGAPFYVLGPLVTDCAAGYDHIAGAIGGTLAAMHGADFLCYLTPAEHLRLPTKDDVIEGVVASRIAAHAADLALGMPYAVERDRAMAVARKELDWDSQIRLALDPDRARNFRKSSEIGQDDVCTMCGEFCAIKRLNEIGGH